MVELLKVAAPLAISVAIALVCLTLLLIIAAVIFGGVDVESGAGKLFSLRITKRSKGGRAADSPETGQQSIPQSPAVSGTEMVIHQPVPQEAEAEDKSKEEVEGTNGDAFWRYLTTTTLGELDECFDSFIKTADKQNIEFWRTDYLQRRERLGADRAREAMRELALQNPSWAMPHAALLNWALEDHDTDEARKHLETGLSKTGSPSFGHLLNAGIRLIFKVDGKQAALAFASQWSNADLPESTRAGAFVTLADLLKDAGDTEGYRVALEFASNIQPANEGRTFSLAYSYAQSNSRWASAVWQYQRCVGGRDDGAVARNNLGILYSHLDKAVAVQTYEQASKDGDKYASANLAHLLIEDGYISIAETLLNDVEDPGPAAENHAAARKAALAARRRAEEKLREISNISRTNVEPYKASLAAAFRNLQRGGETDVMGSFASTDCHVVAISDGSKVLCQLRVGNVVFEGALLNQVTCFVGWLSTKGATLLGSEVSECTLLNEGNGVLRLFRWPSSVGLQHSVSVYELLKSQVVPELAPPPQTQSQGLQSNPILRNALMSDTPR